MMKRLVAAMIAGTIVLSATITIISISVTISLDW